MTACPELDTGNKYSGTATVIQARPLQEVQETPAASSLFLWPMPQPLFTQPDTQDALPPA